MHAERDLRQRSRVVAMPEGVHAARGGLSEAIGPLALTTEEIATVQPALAEALNDIVEPAYPGMERDYISISTREGRDGLHCRLSDSGAPIPDGRAPLGDGPGLAERIEDLPESGLGWLLIRNLARDLQYRRVDAGSLQAFRNALRPGKARR